MVEDIPDRLECHVHTHYAAETETVHDRAGGVSDPGGNALELSVLDPVAQRGAGETDDSDRQGSEQAEPASGTRAHIAARVWSSVISASEQR